MPKDPGLPSIVSAVPRTGLPNLVRNTLSRARSDTSVAARSSRARVSWNYITGAAMFLVHWLV